MQKGLSWAVIAFCGLFLAGCGADETASETQNTAQTTSYPTETVTLVVPFSAGGGTDILARHMAKNLSDAWSVPVIVKNVTGASGRVAENYVMTRPADGYTLYLNNSSFATVPPILTPDTPKVDGFTALGSLAKSASLLIVPADSQFTSIEALLTDSNDLFVGTCGLGTPQHWAAKRLKRHEATTHVPYGGCSDALLDVVRGELSAGIVTKASATPMIESGKVRALAITSAESTNPEIVPSDTWLDDGPNLDQWYAVFIHEKAPEAIKETISDTLMNVFNTPQFEAELAPLSLTPYLHNGTDFDGALKAEQAAFIESAKHNSK